MSQWAGFMGMTQTGLRRHRPLRSAIVALALIVAVAGEAPATVVLEQPRTVPAPATDELGGLHQTITGPEADGLSLMPRSTGLDSILAEAPGARLTPAQPEPVVLAEPTALAIFGASLAALGIVLRRRRRLG
jgi:hypothetical protein